MKKLLYFSALLLASIFLSSPDCNSYQILERTLPPVLGACLGGVLACTSIVISVLSGSSKKTKESAKNSENFRSFVSELEIDLKALVFCLVFTIFLPYLRSLDYPLSLSLYNLDPPYLKNKFFSSAEILFSLIAFFIIFELVSILVIILKNMMSIHETSK